MNQEALYFSRLAGDRTMELLTLQNASIHAGFLGRPREALHLARSVLESRDRLSSRVKTLFLVRKPALWRKVVTSRRSDYLAKRAHTSKTGCEIATRSGHGGLTSKS